MKKLLLIIIIFGAALGLEARPRVILRQLIYMEVCNGNDTRDALLAVIQPRFEVDVTAQVDACLATMEGNELVTRSGHLTINRNRL